MPKGNVPPCRIDGCRGTHKGLGLCEKHYQRFRRYGTTDLPIRPPRAFCSMEGCERPVIARGWCAGHHNRWFRTGSPERWRPRIPERERFWSFVFKAEDADSCWLWTGYTVQGYGRFQAGERSIAAHRYMWEQANGPIPAGIEVDHLCHDPETCRFGDDCPHRRCVNPRHLALVTHAENVRRSGSWSGQNGRKERCPQGHPYEEANLYFTADGGRRCRTCKLEWGRRHHLSKPLRAAVFERDDHRCLTCGAIDDLTLDYDTPLSKGGSPIMENLRTLCRSCNSRKRDR